jgi:oligosaccharide translocation protein RFT1
MASSLIGKAVSTAGQLAARGLLERVLTFTLNQLLVRFVDPEVFGLASIRFELILSTVLFLSREGLRLAMIRLPQLDLMPKPGEGRAAKDGRQRFINTCWLSAPVGVLFSLGAGLVLWWTTAAGADGGAGKAVGAGADGGASDTARVLAAGMLYCLAAAIESLGEPLYIASLINLRTELRVKAEGTAVIARTVATFLLVVFGGLGVVSFGLAQVVYSLVLVGIYVRAYAQAPEPFPWPSVRPAALESGVLR